MQPTPENSSTPDSLSYREQLNGALASIDGLETHHFYSHGNDVFHPDAESIGKVLSVYMSSREALREGIETILEYLDDIVEANKDGATVLVDIGCRNIDPRTIGTRLKGLLSSVGLGAFDVRDVHFRDPRLNLLWEGIIERGYEPVIAERFETDFDGTMSAYAIGVRRRDAQAVTSVLTS